MEILAPSDTDALCAVIRDASAQGRKLALRGNGSKTIGAPEPDAAILDMRGFSGVVDYDPPELVLTVRAGTPLSEVQALVAGEGQMLAFEPLDPSGRATIGGMVAGGLSGSRRVSAGAVRDHLLGFEAVSGRGERFVAGGKVVKNVTGYDLPKLLAGSWGRLAALVEVTLKVLPRPRHAETLLCEGMSLADAQQAMNAAIGSTAVVAAVAHYPGMVALRLEGFEPSVRARRALFPAWRTAEADEAAAFWNALADPLPDAPTLWRISVPPARGAALIAQLDGPWLGDWAGGLIWYGGNDDPRERAAALGGHALLFRAPEPVRRTVAALHPQPDGVARLEERVRRAFDPAGIFETGRFA